MYTFVFHEEKTVMFISVIGGRVLLQGLIMFACCTVEAVLINLIIHIMSFKAI